MSPAHCLLQKEMLEEGWGLNKLHRTRLKEVPAGSIWDNLSIKITWNLLNKAKSHASLPIEIGKKKSCVFSKLPNDQYRKIDGVGETSMELKLVKV